MFNVDYFPVVNIVLLRSYIQYALKERTLSEGAEYVVWSFSNDEAWKRW